jgi:sec-independent protein translocase protein TatA
MGSLSFTHILILALVLVVFFGPSRLPQLGSSVGKAIKGFKKGLNEEDSDVRDINKS